MGIRGILSGPVLSIIETLHRDIKYAAFLYSKPPIFFHRVNEWSFFSFYTREGFLPVLLVEPL